MESCKYQKVSSVPVAEIVVPPEHRKPTEAAVEALAESMEALGQLVPIIVDDDYRLVCGGNRLAAAKKLGWSNIFAGIVTIDACRAQLAEIDENLCRAELTALERSQQLKRRKELYLALHPQTAQHVAGGVAKKAANCASGNMPLAQTGQNVGENEASARSFAADTSKATGLSKSTIERDVSLAESLPKHVADMIAETPVADNKAELKRLAKLKHDQMLAVAKKLADGEAANVAEAKQQLSAKPTDERRKDDKDVVIPEALLPYWETGDELLRIVRELTAIKSRVLKIAETFPLAAPTFRKDIDNAKRLLKFSIPSVVCRFCRGRGCDKCKDRGWMVDSATSRLEG